MGFHIPIVTFILSTAIHFAVQNIFIYYKKFDDINHRSSHKNVATRTGGIGVFSTFLVISLFYYFQGIDLFDYSLFIPLGIMFIVGVYDDLYSADFKLKFFLQIITAKILIDQGYVIENYYGLFGIHEIPWLVAQLSTIFIFLVIVNAINFIDGIDGLAITEFIKIIFIIEFFKNDFNSLSILGVLVISSTLPLYYFNFKSKKKVFLGDGGSLFLGTLIMIFLLNVLGAEYEMKINFLINKTLFLIILLIYPLVDLLRVFYVRIKSGKSPFVADQNHLHHFLLKKGFSHFNSVVIIQLITISLFVTVCLFIFFKN